MQKLRSIQVLRAVAACAVVVLHAYPDAHGALGNAGYGAAGVDLFFVISGFIIANVAEGRRAGEFLHDRLWRIYPMWWLAVLPWLFMLPRGGTFVASSLTLWPIYPGGYYVPVLKVGWTLSFELLFYCGMALAIATRRWLPLLVYGLCFAGALTTRNSLLHFIGSPMALEFLMGVAVARLPRRAAIGTLIPIALLLFALTPAGIGDPDLTLSPAWALRRAFEWGVPAALIVWGALSLEPFFNRRMFDAPVAVGDASYAIYLFHPLIAYGFAFPWSVRIVVAVGVGYAMHRLVERRIMAARRSAPQRLLNLQRAPV